MLSFPIRTVLQGAISVDTDLASDDSIWMEGDTRPLLAVHLTGRLSDAGGERFYFSGSLEGKAVGECRRCLAEVEFDVKGDLQLIYVDADDESVDDPDVYSLSDLGTELDLRPAVREQWLLEASVLPLCRDDCRGLCPSCGTDLNVGSCSCAVSN